jgi:tetratricopeptide (TPR) repeat protein
VGYKSGRTGKHIVLYLAVGCLTAAINIVSCAPVQDKIAEIRARQRLEQYRENLAASRFETVILESNTIIRENETEPPADIAFYALGEVYAHHEYEGRDYDQAQYYFEKLIENFPQSPLTSEAKTYISLLGTIAAKEKTAAAREQIPVPTPTVQPVGKVKKTVVTPPRTVVEDQNFDAAIKNNLRILDEAGKNKPADQALYNLGLIYAHADNPAKDYKKSQIYFHVLTKQFPDSEFAEEATIWLGLFETIDKMQQIDIEIEQQKKQLIR